jgi:hypothetical protein
MMKININKKWSLLLHGLRFGVLFLVLISSVQAQNSGQDTPDVVRRIEQAIANHDMRSLMRDVGDPLTVRIFNSSNTYSPAQARYVLEDFFRDHPTRNFRFGEVSVGTTSHFAVGDFKDRNGENTLRVYARIRREGRDWLLRELRISEVK